MPSLLDRLRHTANWLNLSTPVGLAVAAFGGARLHRTPDALYVAEGYRYGFPRAGAFTIGDVVITASTMDALAAHFPDIHAHERRHSWQFAVGGVWFLPIYLLASAWSFARTGNPALANPLERHAGLVTGGYVHSDTGAPLGAVWMFRGAPGLTRAFRRGRRPTGGAPTGSPDASRAADATASPAAASAPTPRDGRSAR